MWNTQIQRQIQTQRQIWVQVQMSTPLLSHCIPLPPNPPVCSQVSCSNQMAMWRAGVEVKKKMFLKSLSVESEDRQLWRIWGKISCNKEPWSKKGKSWANNQKRCKIWENGGGKIGQFGIGNKSGNGFFLRAWIVGRDMKNLRSSFVSIYICYLPTGVKGHFETDSGCQSLEKCIWAAGEVF